MRSNTDRLRDVLEAVERIEKYAAKGKGAFETDELIQNWIVSHLRIIGEACRAISDDFRHALTDIPWSEIIGMRNILFHHYFEIDKDIVWGVVENELADLAAKMRNILGPE